MVAVSWLTLLSATSVELVLMQELLPEHCSSAVGLTYFVKAAGAIVAIDAIGAMGDEFGLRGALVVGVVIGMLGLLFLAGIPSTSPAADDC